MKESSYNNIIPAENVNLSREADRIEGNVDRMLQLVEMIFGFEEDRFPPS